MKMDSAVHKSAAYGMRREEVAGRLSGGGGPTGSLLLAPVSHSGTPAVASVADATAPHHGVRYVRPTFLPRSRRARSRRLERSRATAANFGCRHFAPRSGWQAAHPGRPQGVEVDPHAARLEPRPLVRLHPR